MERKQNVNKKISLKIVNNSSTYNSINASIAS